MTLGKTTAWMIRGVLLVAFAGAPLLAAIQKTSSPVAPRRTGKKTESKMSRLLRVPAVVPLKSGAAKEEARPVGRDPFQPLIIRSSERAEGPSLPGKRGLRIRTLRLQGIIRSGSQWTAMVNGPGVSGAIFLHVHDEVADGKVVAITRDSVVFAERATDPLGKPIDRDVVKKLSGSGGAF